MYDELMNIYLNLLWYKFSIEFVQIDSNRYFIESFKLILTFNSLGVQLNCVNYKNRFTNQFKELK